MNQHKTVIYQSYRNHNVPEFINQCLESVRRWANTSNFDYVFYGDEFFDAAPGWYRDLTGHNVLLVTDLARLEVARTLLNGKYERAIWVDADVIIFDPDNFLIAEVDEYAFCKEIWIDDAENEVWCVENVNNAVSVFMEGGSFLTFYIDACKMMVKTRHLEIEPISVGTTFLTNLHSCLRFPLLTNVGLFSPVLIDDIYRKDYRLAATYMQRYAHPLAAANLCGSQLGIKHWKRDLIVTDVMYKNVIKDLVETKGDILNRYL